MAQRSSLLRTILLTLLILLLSSIGYALRIYQDHHHTSHQASPTSTIQPSYHPGKVPAVGKLLLATQSASGSHITPVFAATGKWNVYWDFECDEAKNNFSITALGAHHPLTPTTQPVNYQGDESGYGTTSYSATGRYQLQITTTPACQWHVTVKTAN